MGGIFLLALAAADVSADAEFAKEQQRKWNEGRTDPYISNRYEVLPKIMP